MRTRWSNGLLLGLYLVSIGVPLAWMLLTSLKTGPEIFAQPWGLPRTPHWVNYVNAWQGAGLGPAFVNSVLVTLGTLALLLPAGAMAAYVLARYAFPGRGVVFGTFLSGMMFPHFLVIVPLFFLLRNMGMLDTLHGLILVYVAYSLSFTVFVLHGFFSALPEELAEAAMLDGCGHAGTFWRVMLPLAKPGLVVTGIFNAIGLWNEYGLALVLVSREEHRTLPLAVADLAMTQHYQSDWGALFAGLVISAVPVLVLYALFKDRILDVMLAGAVKG